MIGFDAPNVSPCGISITACHRRVRVGLDLTRIWSKPSVDGCQRVQGALRRVKEMSLPCGIRHGLFDAKKTRAAWVMVH